MEYEKDKISVIIPVYNVEMYLNRCVHSVVKQSYKNLEIILIDDGSTDRSGSMCDVYQDSRIRVYHKKNQGLGLSRNLGIKFATGKYIMFVDSDDYIDQEMIENLYNNLIVNNADTCIGGFKRVYPKHNINYVNPDAGKLYVGKEIIPNVLEKMLGKNSIADDHVEMSVWKVIFSSKIINKYDIKFPSEREFISEDIIFDIDYYSKSESVYMSADIGYNYCDNENSLTTKYNPCRFEMQKKLFLELIQRTKKLGFFKNSEQRLINTFVSNSRYCIKLEQKFSEVNGRKKHKNNIKKICHDSVLQNALTDYSVKEPIKSKIINSFIKNKSVGLLWCTMKIKNIFEI